ncbi:MFS maltose permease MalP [Talaromyces proteolyticus]|uniref:MFS maltose permease MalP n=1 Tax=Talaromyces proteolyticus TaxID=1131652 RepID=A0AAD4PRS2_9EURO|nr:MFS maltose permease MalP [Talaromyces proteolyticus]KAH8689609.1 MFS maltose permease MalP [Talaromyces proteolyticus]
MEATIASCDNARTDDAACLKSDARDATETEHHMSIIQAIKIYPKAVGWSILLSTAIVMEGYDVSLLSNFYALPQFNQKYGELQPDGSYVVPAPWKSALSNGVIVGEILGLYITGIIQDRFGYRKTILGALVLVTCFIFIVFFAQNVRMLLAGEILCGIPWGVFQTLTTAYASEVCPVALRAYLTTYVNLCWVIGGFIASGVLRGLLEMPSSWAYRIPFAIQWFWPVPLIIGCLFAPESPWWYVQHGRIDEAKRSLLRLTSRSDTTFDVDKTISMMQHTNELEKEISAGTTYWDCFKGVNLRRTEIVCVAWLVQNLCGSTFMGYSTVFYIAAGLSESSSFDMTLVQYAVGAAGTIGSWFLMSRFGRRTLYQYGILGLFCLLMIIGFTSLAPRTDAAANWAIGSMLLVFAVVYDSTVGPVCYSLVSEFSSTRLRAKSIVLARNLYNIAGIVANILTNYQLTSTAWNWGAKAAFFWAGCCFICLLWVFFRLPEPKGRTYAELDILFAQGIPARKFKSTQVDLFHPIGPAVVDNTSASNEDDKPEVVFKETC